MSPGPAGGRPEGADSYLERALAAEAALRESETLYRTLLDNLADAITINVGGRRLYVNRAFVTLCGLRSSDEAIGTSVGRYYVPEDARQVVERTLARQRGEPVPTTYRARVVRPDGEVRFVETAAVAVSYQGQPASLAVIRDVTERQGMEERLLRAQRLEAAGRVAGQVAHDLNNLLGPLVALPELLKPLLSADEEAQGMCNTMLCWKRPCGSRTSWRTCGPWGGGASSVPGRSTSTWWCNGRWRSCRRPPRR